MSSVRSHDTDQDISIATSMYKIKIRNVILFIVNIKKNERLRQSLTGLSFKQNDFSYFIHNLNKQVQDLYAELQNSAERNQRCKQMERFTVFIMYLKIKHNKDSSLQIGLQV